MGEVRDRFEQMLRIRHLSEKTIASYLQIVRELVRFHNRSPLEMTEEDIRNFLFYITETKKIAPRSVNVHIAALRTFYRMMTGNSRIMEPFRKVHVPQSIPVFLERSEIQRLLAAIGNLKHKAAVLLMYSSGLRVSECASLQLHDIESSRMLVRVNQGKGGKDRYSVLSAKALDLLRDYYRQYRPKKWLFENSRGKPITARVLMWAVKRAALRVGFGKHVTAHTLRHSFATHLLENGAQLQAIQEVLGHKYLKTTAEYTHVTPEALARIKSPLDNLNLEAGHAK